jgi:hypothetical protein
MRDPISIEDKIGMSLIWLGNGNGLQLMGDLFGIVKSIV